jgi:hypothetical protein
VESISSKTKDTKKSQIGGRQISAFMGAFFCPPLNFNSLRESSTVIEPIIRIPTKAHRKGK